MSADRYGPDIYTEPDADPDGIANLGPLRGLAGTWETAAGVDVHPVGAGSDMDGVVVDGGGGLQNVFVERYDAQPIDPQTNGPQLFYGLRYHVHIVKPGEVETFHDQVGYWLWEPATGLILQTVAIPRGQVLLASGQAKPDDMKISVTAKRGDTRYGICSTEFLDEAFRTESYRCDISFNDDGSWTYLIETELMVKGRDQPFNHHDTNTLKRVGEAALNPLAAILKDRAEKK
jgi:hypothetical protein